MREQKTDQDQLAQNKQKKKDLEMRKKDLEDQRQQYIHRIEQCEDYIRYILN